MPVFLTAALLWAAQQNRGNTRSVDHAHDVLTALAKVEETTTRAESSARAYFLTREGSRATEFEKLQAEDENLVLHLRDLVAANPSQQSRVAQLSSTVHARLQYLEYNLGLLRSGMSVEEISAARGTEGTRLIAAVRDQVGAVRSAEERLLVERVATRRQIARFVGLLCLCAMLFSLAIAFTGERTIRRYRDLRDRAEQRLNAANELLEQRVRERTAELERSNDDLRQFAFAASHDLNEPLRTVGIYTDMLRQRHLHALDGDAAQVVGFILKGVARMDGLLGSLRTYLQVSTLGREAAPLLGLRAGVDAALGDLKTLIEESGASVECGDLPRVRIHPVHAREVFQNLLGNAVKYRGASTPSIAISSEQKNGEWVIRVRDNGIGIDPQHGTRIFELFKRLHAADAIPGSGMGLAICRTIVQKYGGQIWVESELGRGSTFSFTLPRAD